MTQPLPAHTGANRARIAAATCGVLALLCGSAPGFAMEAGASVPPQPALIGLQRAEAAFQPATAMRGTTALGVFNPRMLDAAEVAVALPDGRILRAQRQQLTESKARGARSWVGTFEEQPGSIATFSTVRGVTAGFVSYGAETYEILPERAGMHVMYRVDDGKLPAVELEDAGTASLDSADPTATTATTGTGIGTTGATTGGVQIDLLVVYTPAAAAAYGATTLATMIENGVAMANQAYSNSRIGITLNIVGLQQVSYVESGVQASLDDLRGTTDGKMDSVHTLRNTVGADVVTLISQDTNACGIASVMTTVGADFESKAFSVVKADCLSQHSLAHEIGHNMGNRHDRDNSTDTGAYPYSYGFRRCVSDGTGFRTVMAYSCAGAARVAWFSNPGVFYNGYATGIAYETSPATSADNARSMSNTAATIAAFRASKTTVGPTPSSLPAAPSALAATVTSSSAINIKWTDNATDETGYVVQRSTDGTNFTQVATLGAGATSHSSSGLAAATTYYFRVRAYNGAGNSAFSNIASAKTSSTTTVPAKPSSVAAVNLSGGSARVTWTDNSGNETYFQVYRQKWSATTSSWVSGTSVVKTGANAVSYVDAPGVGTFRYKVRAGNAAGYSAYVTSASVKVTR
jgi:hypothetical protein